MKRDGKGPVESALARAEKLGVHARDLGMDWRDVGAVLAKVREELDEAADALARGDREAAAEEIGDMMLALSNAPRFLDRSAEETLSRACDKFVTRFEHVKRSAAERGLDLRSLGDSEIDMLWNEAKKTRP